MKDAPTIHWTGDREDLVKKNECQVTVPDEKEKMGMKNVHVHGKKGTGTH